MPKENADWIKDELILALDLYLRNPESPPGKSSREVRELSTVLGELGRQLGLRRGSKFRNPNGVYMKLMPSHAPPQSEPLRAAGGCRARAAVRQLPCSNGDQEAPS
jgi:hypothetical protein